jgi:hypothetical protein
LVDIEVGDYSLPKAKLDSTPTLDAPLPSFLPPSRINLRSATYHTTKEVANGFAYKDRELFKDENNVTTNSGDESEARYDSTNDEEFNDIEIGDYDEADGFMDVD